MPYKYPSYGYDALYGYSVDEIFLMYLDEGIEEKEAKERAELISKEITKLNVNEHNSWKKAYKNEILFSQLGNPSRHLTTS